jgi:hypothetical protein
LISCQSKQENKSESANHSNFISIQQARDLSIGSEVRIQGTISVASRNFSSSTPFGYALQDNTAGIYIIDWSAFYTLMLYPFHTFIYEYGLLSAQCIGDPMKSF